MRLIEIILTETYSAYVLSKKSRAKILATFPPKFSDIRSHHITVKFGLSKDDRIPHQANVKVVGYTADDSLEAVVVSVNGKTQRPDGKIYHITLSHEPNRKSSQSNNVIAAGWKEINNPFEIETTPEILK
jgi:hypothetical protein